MSINRSNEINNETNTNNQEDDSSSGSSVYVRVIPGNDPTDYDTEGSADSQALRPKCTIRIQVKKGSDKGISEFATVKVTQDDFHKCRVYTVDPVKQRRKQKRRGKDVVKVWSSAADPLFPFRERVPPTLNLILHLCTGSTRNLHEMSFKSNYTKYIKYSHHDAKPKTFAAPLFASLPQ